MKIKITILILLLGPTVFAQQFINGSFENDLSGNTFLPTSVNVTQNHLDSAFYCSTVWFSPTNAAYSAQEGSFFYVKQEFIDYKITMKLDAPLISGTTYAIRFYANTCMALSYRLEINSTSDSADSNITSPIVTIMENPATAGTWKMHQVEITPTAPSEYISVFFYWWNEIVAIDNFSISEVTDVKEHKLMKVSTSPNPSKGLFRLSSKENITSIYVHDLTGKNILNKQNINTTSYQVDLSNYPSGIYFATVHDKSGSSSIVKLFKN